MFVGSTFDITKKSLQELLGGVESGAIQLPDFQRNWIWDDDRIRGLLASVSKQFPIGAVMMLQTGNPAVNFKPRSVEGAEVAPSRDPEFLILDGQQRLTALFLALKSGKPVPTVDAKNKKIRRWYYVDVAKAIDPTADREEAIVSLPEERVVRNFRSEVILDASTVEKEIELGLFPLAIVFDNAKWFAWQNAYNQCSAAEFVERSGRMTQFFSQVINAFGTYDLPVITLGKQTSKEAVCLVFEKVNTGGVPLNVFELLTATFAAENFQLRDDWEKRQRQLREHRQLTGIQNDDFLQAVTLLATYARRQSALDGGTEADRAPGVSCKRKDVLDLTLDEYRAWADKATVGFLKAAKFVLQQGIFASRDLPYRTQLVPIAAALALLGHRGETNAMQQKLARWYWCGVFGELYGSATETRFARDLVDLIDWATLEVEPKTVADANFAPQRLLTLRTRNSAAYKGLFALAMRNGGEDFITGSEFQFTNFFADEVDIHHIFPKVWCERSGIDSDRVESFVNKTAIAARTNKVIGGNAPSTYMSKLQHLNPDIDASVSTHFINPAFLRADDFDGFFADRSERLLGVIERATGKTIARTPIDLGEDYIEIEEG